MLAWKKESVPVKIGQATQAPDHIVQRQAEKSILGIISQQVHESGFEIAVCFGKDRLFL